MFIQTHPMYDPALMRFTPGEPVLAVGAPPMGEADAAAQSPLVRRLLRIEEVEAVSLALDDLTIRRSATSEWYILKPAILGAIMEHYQSGQPVIEAGEQQDGHTAHEGADSEIVNQIKELLDTRVRPAVAQDGGDITFHGFDRGIVYLHMKGACAGCPSSTMTLKMGIENLLRHYIPEVTEVRPVAA